VRQDRSARALRHRQDWITVLPDCGNKNI